MIVLRGVTTGCRAVKSIVVSLIRRREQGVH